MSLTTIHTRQAARKRFTPDEERVCRRHEAACLYAERFTRELLTRVFRAYHAEGTPVDLSAAARIVAEQQSPGETWLECLYLLAWSLDNEGWFPHWRRRDLVPAHVRAGVFLSSLKVEN